jgi:hypothetical protein
MGTTELCDGQQLNSKVQLVLMHFAHLFDSKSVCLSVCLSVGRSVGRSAGWPVNSGPKNQEVRSLWICSQSTTQSVIRFIDQNNQSISITNTFFLVDAVNTR